MPRATAVAGSGTGSLCDPKQKLSTSTVLAVPGSADIVQRTRSYVGCTVTFHVTVLRTQVPTPGTVSRLVELLENPFEIDPGELS